jgi:hypothetical protein
MNALSTGTSGGVQLPSFSALGSSDSITCLSAQLTAYRDNVYAFAETTNSSSLCVGRFCLYLPPSVFACSDMCDKCWLGRDQLHADTA